MRRVRITPLRLPVRTPNATIDARVQLKQISHMYVGLLQLFPSWMPACSCFDLHLWLQERTIPRVLSFGMAVSGDVDILV
jgi:hypothetical protein